MTTWFVSRHAGAIKWARERGIDAEFVKHLDVKNVKRGDIVIGTLPVPLAAEVCAKGARYVHLNVDVPEHMRGKELSEDELEGLGAKLEGFMVTKSLVKKSQSPKKENPDA